MYTPYLGDICTKINELKDFSIGFVNLHGLFNQLIADQISLRMRTRRRRPRLAQRLCTTGTYRGSALA